MRKHTSKEIAEMVFLAALIVVGFWIALHMDWDKSVLYKQVFFK